MTTRSLTNSWENETNCTKLCTKRKRTTAPASIRVHEMEAVICSESMRKLMTMVERVARGNAAVLITGETGSGKEVIARAIHYHSLRANKAWVDVNCAALPEHLVESELFGYEKGAFSGADSPKPGLFELADKGTLFLDEIGELEPRVQVKLLRVLDGVPYYRLGGQRKVSVDVRIVAATNTPLDEAVRAGRFRSDLFHRLTQIMLRVPPLRERPDDISPLVSYFLEQIHPEMNVSDEALQRLIHYDWPGNIRELRNVILQAATLAQGPEIRPAELPPELAPTSMRDPRGNGIGSNRADGEGARVAALDDVEKDAILRALERCDGHQGHAAEQLGISRRTLSRKLKQYGVAGIETREDRTLGFLAGFEQQHFRANLDVPVSLAVGGAEYTARAQNVSAGGMGIKEVANPFLLARGFQVRFTLPDTHETIEAHGRIVWGDPHGNVGIHFTEFSEDSGARLKAWIIEKQRQEGWATRE